MKILIVEDEAISALALRLLVERLGHEVVDTVDTGEQAIAAVDAKHPDLVLMDTRLRSEMSGVEAANEIWARREVRSIFISAHDAADIEARYRGGQPFVSLVKPVLDEDLAVALSHALPG